MQVLIIEDERPAAEKLIRSLHRIDEHIAVLDVLDSIKKATAWLQTHRADLIFLDIHLADGVSFKIFEQLEEQGIRQIDTPIIFTTAYDEYAIQAFKLNSIDYLLKPIGRKDLANSLSKYRRLRENADSVRQDVRSLLESIRQPRHKKRFMVRYGQRMKSVQAEQVAYFFAQEKMVFMLTFENQQYIVDQTIGELDEVLDPEFFFRINRKFIINIEAIVQMHAYSKSRVKLELTPQNQMEAVVSVERSAAFKAWLDR